MIRSSVNTRAFSLVELSIVLVILGLLTGGILAGQSLIRASELRSHTTDIQRTQAALNTFRDKYFALPGDFRDATKFWTSLGGTGSDATCQDLAATGQATCNGNGDGRIDTSTTVTYDERFRIWQHLANAGLIEGAYTGKTAGASGTFTTAAGSNVPAWKANTIADITYTGAGATSFRMDAAQAGTILCFRAAATGVQPLTPSENWNIDVKMDDGKPGTGLIIGAKNTWSALGCSTTDVSATAEYSLTNPAKICRFDFNIMN